MSFQPGDFAIINSGDEAGNEGLIVQLGIFLGTVSGWRGNDRWEINLEIESRNGAWHKHTRAIFLNPITSVEAPAPREATLTRSGLNAYHIHIGTPATNLGLEPTNLLSEFITWSAA